MAKRKRHQQSSIDRLPPDIREKFMELLRDPRVQQIDAIRRINAILEEEGHPERITKSSGNRFAVRMEDVGAKIRESREIADMWIGKLGAEPQGNVGKLLNETVRCLAFDAASKLAEGEVPVEPRALKDLAIAIERLERAASENVKRDEEIRKRALEDAAETVEKTAKQAGVSQATIKAIRRDVLRMADA